MRPTLSGCRRCADPERAPPTPEGVLCLPCARDVRGRLDEGAVALLSQYYRRRILEGTPRDWT
ncbi:MAG TPA: hypothetical protein VM889_01575 [Candidatus Thermoplasmatota archaeon]|nr:hypothetical protein [Candidatus Thermoplasmatota archaeon]